MRGSETTDPTVTAPASKPRVLVVDDEPTILENVLYVLACEGMEPAGFATGGEALEAIRSSHFDLAVVDVGLPDTTGFELCKSIRDHSQLPVVFLTARSSEIDRIVGLEIGGDDYVVKPFSPRELAARVKAILRRCASSAAPEAPQPSAAAAAAGAGRAGIAIDRARARVSFHGAALELSSTEFKLISALAAEPGRVFSRSQLMDRAWDDPASALERTVDAHVKSLRAKLRSAAPEAGDPIVTHRGLGYSLDCPDGRTDLS